MDFEGILEKLDLSGHRGEVYKSIVCFPGSTANQIQEHSAVPKNKIYQYLDDLYARDLIYITMERPRLYWPREIESVLHSQQKVLNEELNELIELKANVGKIVNSLKIEQGQNSESRAKMVMGQPVPIDVVSGNLSKVFGRCIKYLKKTKNTLTFLGDWDDYKNGIKNYLSVTVEKLVNQGIKIRQIVCLNENFFNEDNIAEIQMIDIRDRNLQDREVLYYIGKVDFNVGVVIIDETIIGFLLKNPILNDFALSFYIESERLISSFNEFLDKISKKLYDTILETPECNHLMSQNID